MKKRSLCFIALLLFFLPVLMSSDGGCTQKKTAFEGMALTEVKVLNVTVDPNSMSPLVLLTDSDRTAILPIVIGSSEALAIATTLENVNFPRPMTHDLIRNILEGTHTSVLRVIITDLKDDTFYAVILLRYKGKELTVDSRPSDAIAVAIRVEAPIFISTELFRSKAIREGVTEL